MKGKQVATNLRDHLYSRMIEEEVSKSLVNKPLMELLKFKYEWNDFPI